MEKIQELINRFNQLPPLTRYWVYSGTALFSLCLVILSFIFWGTTKEAPVVPPLELMEESWEQEALDEELQTEVLKAIETARQQLLQRINRRVTLAPQKENRVVRKDGYYFVEGTFRENGQRYSWQVRLIKEGNEFVFVDQDIRTPPKNRHEEN